MVPKEDGGKTSSHWLPCAQQGHTKVYLACAKGRRHFCPTHWHNILLNLGSMSRISQHSIGWVINTKNSLHLTIWKIWIHQSTLLTQTSTCIFLGTHDRFPKGFSFHYCLPGQYNHLQKDGRGTHRPHHASFPKFAECPLINETQQMPLLCQRGPVPWTHPQHDRHQTTAIKDSSHQKSCTHLKQLSRYAHF